MFQIWQYAALSEFAYRRAGTDQALDLEGILGDADNIPEFNGAGDDDLPAQLQAAGLRENGGHLYNPQLTAVHGAHNEPLSEPEELVKVRDGFELVLTRQASAQEITQSPARYEFDSFGFLLQANHETRP